MRLLVLVTAVLLSTASAGFAQKNPMATLKGVVSDSILNQPLEAATIAIYAQRDSSLLTYTVSDKNGQFEIKKMPALSKLKIVISFNGYYALTRIVSIPANQQQLDLGNNKLVKSYTELDEVIVVAEKPPVVFKKDTVEFNAGSFNTRPNAVVEDLLKQLPGVEVDKDGNITVNGKAVTKITVDGKDFFGTDPTIATKNLPKDIVDKIQVVANLTKEQVFNKSATGNEDKAINITLKKDKKQGWFGRATAGYGSRSRYEAGVSANYFNDKTQVNIIGSANNTNRMNFSRGGSGNRGGSGGGNGITESASAGINFSNQWSKDVKINGNYFYSNGSVRNNTRRKRENILPDSSFFTFSDNDNKNNSQSHQMVVNGDYRIDTMTDVHFNIGLNYNNSQSISANNSTTESPDGELLNKSNNSYSSNSHGNALNGGVFLSRRLNSKGRGISLNISFNDNDRTSINDNIGQNTFFRTGSSEIDSIDQRSTETNTGSSISVSATYSEPLLKNLTLLLSGGYNKSNSSSDRRTFTVNRLTGKYDIEDSAFTNSFRNNRESYTPTVSFNYNKEKLRASISNGIQWLKQESFSVTGDSLTSQQYMNFFPTANIGYQVGKSSNLSLNYNGRTQQPSIQQLQPIADNRNPLFIRMGNPNLQPSFTHAVNLNLNLQKIENNSYWYGSANYNTTDNQIMQEVYFDSLGRQVSRPINTDGNYSSGFYITYGKRWKQNKWSLRFNTTSGLNHGKSTVFNNKVLNKATSYGFSERIGFDFDLKDKFSIRPQFSIRYSDLKYSIEQSGQAATNITQNYSLEIMVNITKKLLVDTEINTNYNSRIAPGFRKVFTNWNAAVNWKLFKKDQGNIRFIIYDLLKQNLNVYRNISQTYIEDVQMDILQQYFLVSFTYNIRKFAR
jgi:hypothetical protein